MLYLPVGPPGCGKTSLRDMAVEAGVITADAVISPDEIRLWMTGDRARQDRNRDVFRVVDAVMSCRLQQGLDVWLDATNLQHRSPSDFHDTTLIVFDTPDDKLWARNITREHPVPDHVLDRMISQFRTWRATNVENYVLVGDFIKTHIER